MVYPSLGAKSAKYDPAPASGNSKPEFETSEWIGGEFWRRGGLKPAGLNGASMRHHGEETQIGFFISPFISLSSRRKGTML
jgi:hypothetical protein